MSGEWLRTGDLVHRDADGVFRVVDRLKDIYISGGENVAPAEVEYALTLHPLIEPPPSWAFPTRCGASGASRSSCPSRGRHCRSTRCSRTRGATWRRSRCRCAWSSSTSLPRSTIEKLARARLR